MLDTSPEGWLAMQGAVDLWEVRNAKMEVLESVKPVSKRKVAWWPRMIPWKTLWWPIPEATSRAAMRAGSWGCGITLSCSWRLETRTSRYPRPRRMRSNSKPRSSRTSGSTYAMQRETLLKLIQGAHDGFGKGL